MSFVALNKAVLRNTNLRRTYLFQADFADCYLLGTDLCGANLKRCNGLTQAQLDQAFGDERTKLPLGLTVPAAPHGH